MGKILEWFFGMTRFGKALKKVQEFLDGKKQLLTGLAGALPASIAIVQNFQAGGVDYLTHAARSPEYAAALIGWGLVFNAIKGEKIRAELADNTAVTLASAQASMNATAAIQEASGAAPATPAPTGTVDPSSHT